MAHPRIPGLPPAPPELTERSVQRSIVAWLRAVLPPRSIVYAVVNEQGGTGDEEQRLRFGQARRKSGVVTGFPDIGALLPGAMFFVECKRPKTGVLSDEQLALHGRIRELGHSVFVADSIEVLRYLLTVAGIPIRDVAPAQVDPRLVARAEKLATKSRAKSGSAVSKKMRAVAKVEAMRAKIMF